MATPKKAAKNQPKKAAQPKATGIRTWLGFVLDKSGSMSVQRDAAINGFNEFLSEQKKVNDDTRLTLVLFDTSVYTLYTAKPLAECKDLTTAEYRPDGGTALWDAIMKASTAIEKQIAKGDRVLITVFTDGEENSSVEITSSEMMQAFIRERESRGNWTFAAMGSAKDFVKHAQRMGVSASNVAQVDPNNVHASIGAMASSTRAYRSSNMMNVSGTSGGLYDAKASYLTPEDVDNLAKNVKNAKDTTA